MPVELLLFQIPFTHPKGNWESVVKPALSDERAHYIRAGSGHHIIGIRTEDAAGIDLFEKNLFGNPIKMLTEGNNVVAIRDRIADFYAGRNSDPKLILAEAKRYKVFAGLEFAHGTVLHALQVANIPEARAKTAGQQNNCNLYYIETGDEAALKAINPMIEDNGLIYRGMVEGYSPNHCWGKIRLYTTTWNQENYPYADVDGGKKPADEIAVNKTNLEKTNDNDPFADEGTASLTAEAISPKRPVVTRFLFNRLPLAEKFKLVHARRRKRLAANAAPETGPV